MERVTASQVTYTLTDALGNSCCARPVHYQSSRGQSQSRCVDVRRFFRLFQERRIEHKVRTLDSVLLCVGLADFLSTSRRSSAQSTGCHSVDSRRQMSVCHFNAATSLLSAQVAVCTPRRVEPTPPPSDFSNVSERAKPSCQFKFPVCGGSVFCDTLVTVRECGAFFGRLSADPTGSVGPSRCFRDLNLLAKAQLVFRHWCLTSGLSISPCLCYIFSQVLNRLCGF